MMKTVILHGQNHHGSTWNITTLLIDKISNDCDDIKEFYMNDIPQCIGCFTCILHDEAKCPHRSFTDEIIKAIDEADVIIAESPNYCMGMTGQLKSFFDHMAFRWFSHRPLIRMSKKVAVAVSSTAGAGAGSVTKQIKQQFFWWGIPVTYKIGFAVAAAKWDDVKPKTRKNIESRTDRIAKKIIGKAGNAKWGIRQRCLFKIMGNMQKADLGSPKDKGYWLENGWIKSK